MIGCGKLGQDCAEVMAEHYEVVGYDIEPRTPSNFKMLPSIEEAVKDRDMIFIAAPTPHDPMYGGEKPTSHLPNKDFDYTIVKEILSEVNKYVTQNQLVILISTVLPGTVRMQLRPCITNARFIYNPYLIAMGTIKWDMVNPEMVIIGTDTGYTTGDAQELIDFYKVFMQNNPRYEVGTWDEAEAIKIFYNTFISTKLALVNMIQDVAETNGNMNVDVVTEALAKSTYRIMGPAYMKAGLGDAGACHPRDNIALRWLADRLDLGYDLFDSIMKARELQAKRMAQMCLAHGKKVTIVGKAYKPKVSYTNGSASMLIGHYIEELGGTVNYYDLHTGDNNLRADWAEVFLIGYWDDYVEKIKFPDGTCVIDPWRKITKSQATNFIHYGDTRERNIGSFYVPQTEQVITNTLPTQVDVLSELISDFNLPTHEHNLDTILEIFKDLAPYKNSLMEINASCSEFKDLPVTVINNAIAFNFTNGKRKFLFNLIGLGLEPNILDKIHYIAENLQQQIPAENFIIVTDAIDGHEQYDIFVRDNKPKLRLTVMAARLTEYFIRQTSEKYRFSGEYKPMGDSNSKHKKFLSLNKTPRKHTLDFIEHLLYSGAVSDGFFSFIPDNAWLSKIDDLDQNKYPTIKSMQHLLPMYVNKNATRTNYKNIHNDDLHFFDQSWFSIISDNGFYGNERKVGLMPTEKVFKCFALKHPFVVFGPPGFLKVLRKLGYKTFAPFIDETYDDIEDDQQRFNVVLKEITRLCSLDAYESIDWTNEIKVIVEHNKYHFYSNENFNITDVSKLIDEGVVNNIPSVIHKVEPIIDTKLKDNDLLQKVSNSTTSIDSSVGKITLMPTLTPNTNRSVFSRLKSGLLLSYPMFLDGGGVAMHSSLQDFMKYHASKRNYNKGLEWCAGCGALGFELLGSGVCKEMVFTDYIDVAIDSCKKNAETNGYSKLVNGYVTPTIDGIPTSEKFDLVIANPPHLSSVNKLDQITTNNPNIDIESISNVARWLVDVDWNIHREFFKNIGKYLTEDADIFLIETHESILLNQIAEEYGIYHNGTHNFIVENSEINYVCSHFTKQKPINNSLKQDIKVSPVEHQSIKISDVRLESIKYSENEEVFVVPVEDMVGTDDIMLRSQLSNGLTIEFPRNLDGNGKIIKDEIVKLIRKSGREKYGKGLQWCSGAGFTGFELLMHKVVDQMSFSDYYPLAIDFVLSNARALGIESKVHGHVTPLVKNIPTIEKYDLVVGIPPNSFDINGYTQFMKRDNSNIPINELSNFARICVDQNFGIHKEFFKNITNYLNSNSDIYLIENAENLEFIIWARNSGLMYAGTYHLESLPHMVVMHFKLI